MYTPTDTRQPRAAALRGILLTAATLLVAACDGTGEEGDDARRVTLHFAATAGSAAIGCDAPATQMGVAQDRTLRIRDFRFYVANIRLLDADGLPVPVTLDDNDWQLQDAGRSVALLDFTTRGDACSGADKPVHTAVTGTVPRGTYTGVAFELGVPPGLNHTSVATAPPPLDNLAMSWSWQSGRKFARLESHDDTLDAGTGAVPATTNQVFHLGSTGCTGGDAGDPESVTCTSPYRPTIVLDGFDAERHVIVADYRQLLSETDLSASYSCMPGTSALCQGITAIAGADAAGASNGTQSFFRVE